MKKLVYLALIAIALTACTSKEKKAEKLIKEELKAYLYKPDSYKPVKTVVTEAYSPYDNPILWEDVKELKDMELEYELTEAQVKSAKSSMANWSDSHSAYGKNEYQEAKEDYDEATAKLEELKAKGKKLYEKIILELKSEKVMIGYKAVHNYRAESNDGSSCIGNVVVIFDKDIEKFGGGLELDEYESIQKYIKDEILKEE
jgi:response regulator RpfG family c-di-GMP phosphodiesterase